MSLFDIPANTTTPHQVPPTTTGPTRDPLPDWLLRRLENAGHIDATTGATRRTRSAFCPHCHHGVMRGLTSPPTSWATDVDPTPLTAEGEVLALLTGTGTYELRWIGDHYELERRDKWAITNNPAATLKHCDILAEHHCKQPARWPTAATKLADTLTSPYRQPHHHPADPPF